MSREFPLEALLFLNSLFVMEALSHADDIAPPSFAQFSANVELSMCPSPFRYIAPA